jgi:hypothetical protein
MLRTGKPRLTGLVLDDQVKLVQVGAVDVASGAGECERCGQASTGGLDIARLVAGTGVEGAVCLTREDVGDDGRDEGQWGEEQHLGCNHPGGS